jgi:hypothetical protein
MFTSSDQNLARQYDSAGIRTPRADGGRIQLNTTKADMLGSSFTKGCKSSYKELSRYNLNPRTLAVSNILHRSFANCQALLLNQKTQWNHPKRRRI